jgi:hypothetical protein
MTMSTPVTKPAIAAAPETVVRDAVAIPDAVEILPARAGHPQDVIADAIAVLRAATPFQSGHAPDLYDSDVRAIQAVLDHLEHVSDPRPAIGGSAA